MIDNVYMTNVNLPQLFLISVSRASFIPPTQSMPLTFHD